MSATQRRSHSGATRLHSGDACSQIRRHVHDMPELFTVAWVVFIVTGRWMSIRDGAKGDQIVQFLLEILKIIDGAVSADRAKVRAYGLQLANKLEGIGEAQAGQRIRRVLENAKMRALEPAHLTETRLPVDGESRLALADEEHPRTEDVVIYLDREQSATVEEFLRYIRNADRLLARGVGVSPSLLLHGPPGCGTTALARYIAAQLGLPLITGRLDSLISSFLGSTAKNLRGLFDHARSRPCILFLDEFDAIAKLRDDQHELGELKRVVVSLLQNIDNLDKTTVLLAATNHAHLLDPAVWRRFAYAIELGLPSEGVRDCIIRHTLKRELSDSQVELLAKTTEGLSGGAIVQLLENAQREAVLSDLDTVNEILVLRRVLLLRGISTLSPDLDEAIRKARMLNPKVFTVRRLAELFGRSTGYISQRIGGEEDAHAYE